MPTTVEMVKFGEASVPAQGCGDHREGGRLHAEGQISASFSNDEEQRKDDQDNPDLPELDADVEAEKSKEKIVRLDAHRAKKA